MNHLKHEQSPYLLQHKDNPVWWYPWGEEAFATAKEENKPVFLSVGYSTCHWCHVMEKESFEKDDVAKVLNDNFVSIKVDREERPDVDDIYMTAVQALTGGGGWPMSVWLTPEGKPFFGGTYFPKDRFVWILERVAGLWEEEREKVKEDGDKLAQALRSLATQSKSAGAAVEPELLDKFVESFHGTFDTEYGGFGQAPKFPQSMTLMAMMRHFRRHRDDLSKIMVTKTLDRMHQGGLYDHVDGGFHRYSVDHQWLVPHFEKMLYDNAFLALTYLEGYQLFKKEDYAQVARETLDYINKQMRSQKGGYLSAEDADSLVPETGEKVEGHFYVYDYAGLKEVLMADELNRLEEVFGVSAKGNFEGQNILHLQPGFTKKVKEEPVMKSAFAKLAELRSKKPRPHLDDKVITAWNGWMITAMTKAYQVFGEKEYLESAQAAGRFFLENLRDGDQVFRHWRDGVAKVPAVSDDYSAMVAAFLSLYESDFDNRWLNEAVLTQELLDQRFWDSESGGYFRDAGEDGTLIARMKEDFDGVRPNASSLSSCNLLKLYHLTLEPAYKQKAEKIFSQYQERMKKVPSGLPQMYIGLDFYLDRVKEIVVAGVGEPENDEFVQWVFQSFLPNKVVARADEPGPAKVAKGKSALEGKATYYVCEEGACMQPVHSVEEAKTMFAYTRS